MFAFSREGLIIDSFDLINMFLTLSFRPGTPNGKGSKRIGKIGAQRQRLQLVVLVTGHPDPDWLGAHWPGLHHAHEPLRVLYTRVPLRRLPLLGRHLGE